METVNYGAFHIASVIVCLSCLCNTIFHKRTSRQQNQIYILILVDILICATASIGVAVSSWGYSPSAHFYEDASRFLYHVFHVALAPLFGYYVLIACGNTWQFKKSHITLLSIPFIIAETIILTNPFTGWLYTYTDSSKCVYQWGFYAGWVAAIIYVLISFVSLLRYWRAVTIAKRSVMMFFIALMFIGIGIQTIWPSIQVEIFMESMTALGLMLSIEDEDDRIDIVTGAYNRRALMIDLKNFLATGKPVQLIGVRISDAGAMHRVLGSSTTDAFLFDVSDYLRTILPPYSIYCANPYTFIILIQNIDEEQAIRLSSQILERFDESWDGGKIELNLHATVMRGTIPKDFPTVEDVLYMTDSPIPTKDGKKILSGHDLGYILRRLEIERALHRGLEENTFEVYYQPVYATAEKKLRSAEALLRLHDSILGSIPPAEFIPTAEQAGIIDNLGEFVLEEVCSFIASGIPDRLGLLDIGVNLSVLQCIQPGFIERVTGIVDAYGVDPKKINFEITESVAATDYNELDHVIRELKAKGFTFSMDDYGTGYSNMQSIFSLDFDAVKIDKGILWSAEKNGIGRAILNNSIRMIREMHRKIIVEGVETEDQINLLSNLSVDYLQGFYFSKPIPKSEFIALAKGGASA